MVADLKVRLAEAVQRCHILQFAVQWSEYVVSYLFDAIKDASSNSDDDQPQGKFGKPN